MSEWTALPAELLTLLRSFGSIIFLPHATLGLLVLIALLCHSRLAVLFALVGYAAGRATLALLPLAAGAVDPLYAAFNFLFCGIALGGVFFIPSWGSLLLAAFGSALCAIVAVAEIGLFRYLGFAPLALPFNIVILSTIYALRLRTTPRLLVANPGAPLRPEENFRRFSVNRARFPHAGYPSTLCPFIGQRVVSQGDNGGITHRGAWRHALDFEVPDDDVQTAPTRLEDNHTYNTPVFAPGHGVVVKVVADVEDRSLGSSNFHHNWGNLAIIHLDGGLYVKLCHLKRDSLVVAEGQRVKPGELIGYCGNSGRSPRPHLHVQLQTTPRVGAATIPFRLRHYLEVTDNGRIYHAAGLPSEEARLQAATSSDRLAALFDNLAERRYRFATRFEPAGGGQPTLGNEEVECSTNELGHYQFHSSSGAELTACIVDRVFYTLDFAGPTDSVLFHFWLGLGRVPFIEELGVRWTDLLDAHGVLRAWAGELATFIGPFAGVPLVHTTSSLEPAEHASGDGADVCLACSIEQRVAGWANALRCSLADSPLDRPRAMDRPRRGRIGRWSVAGRADRVLTTEPVRLLLLSGRHFNFVPQPKLAPQFSFRRRAFEHGLVIRGALIAKRLVAHWIERNRHVLDVVERGRQFPVVLGRIEPQRLEHAQGCDPPPAAGIGSLHGQNRRNNHRGQRHDLLAAVFASHPLLDLPVPARA